MLLMDAYSPTVLRPDRHASPNDGDCLHYNYAYPSALLHWVRLLFNMLAAAKGVVVNAGNDLVSVTEAIRLPRPV